MKLNLYPYLLFLVILIFGFTTNNPIIKDAQQIAIIALQNTKNYSAGEKIVLKFKANQPIDAYLLVEGSYGKTLLDPQQQQNEHLVFEIPQFLSQKRGVLNYTLLFDRQEIYSGDLHIRSVKTIKEPLESYLGPTSIIAGGIDYAMITVIPSDQYDNPIADSTLVVVKHQFLEKEKESELYIQDFIVWKNIYSYEKSGRMLVSANTNDLATKEFTLDVFPAQSQDFDLNALKKHEYADGNQIVKFFTSTIKDSFGNVVSDGRVVEFSIETDTKEQLRTTGTTINGVATGYMVHPDVASIWNAQAFIPEMAESKTLTLAFKPAVKDYTIKFTEKNRKIKVGAIVSFMNQIIPDGAMISLYVYDTNRLKEKLIEFSSKGFVEFYLSEDFFPKGIYTIEVTGMGISKRYDRIELE